MSGFKSDCEHGVTDGGEGCKACQVERKWQLRQDLADDLQRRRYAEAALTGWGEAHHSLTAQGTGNANIYIHVMAEVCFDIADAMLQEQKRREGNVTTTSI